MARIRRLFAAAALMCVTFAGSVSPAIAAQPNTAGAWGWRAHVERIVVPVANVRACPSTRCRIVFKVYRGTRVYTYSHRGGWTNIGNGRWIASYLISR
jgi:hypothetical protein